MYAMIEMVKLEDYIFDVNFNVISTIKVLESCENVVIGERLEQWDKKTIVYKALIGEKIYLLTWCKRYVNGKFQTVIKVN